MFDVLEIKPERFLRWFGHFFRKGMAKLVWRGDDVVDDRVRWRKIIGCEHSQK